MGKHARSAVGMQALPSNSAVEVEMIVEIEEEEINGCRQQYPPGW